ncbi:hypothetical protein KSZ_32620 [Dictyobacter formicarum]|uniref:Uncharacterized protein n=2 Tax=Dictyobacter formicarum TaxID=2778368 RepID=A0ABQ3VIF6_9CHLR|nr:hypothetical protein KSZ_32620 [Dictyobacter formicarum]
MQDPNSWGTYTQALHALNSGRYQGIGFVFTNNDPFIAIHLAHCAHDNHKINYIENALVKNLLQSYTEYADPDNLHVLIKASMLEAARQLNTITLLNSGHALSLTLRHVPDTPLSIAERQSELDTLISQFENQAKSKDTPVWQMQLPYFTLAV